MSRSYRKPYSPVTGAGSAKEDKRHAARGVRSKQNQWLRNLEEFDDSLVPHWRECANNDVWGWGRDGKQTLQQPSNREHTQYSLTQQGLFRGEWEAQWMREKYAAWPPTWYAELTRK